MPERRRHLLLEIYWGKYLHCSALLGIGLGYAFGILLALSICSATSGGHFNPCISIAQVVFRGFPLMKAARFIVFQVLGGYIACLLVYAQWRDLIHAAEAALTAAGRLEAVQFSSSGTGGILALYAPPGAHLGLTWVNEFVTVSICARDKPLRNRRIDGMAQDFVLALAIWACIDPTNVLVPPQAAPWVISFA